MDIDIAQLAGQMAAFLGLFLPYLLKGGKIAAKKAFEKAGEKFSEQAWERAERLWGKLKPRVEAKPAAQEAVEEFVKDPDEEDALPVLRQQIRRILAEDPGFAREISIAFMEIDRSSIQAGDENIIVKGSVGKNLVRGNNNMIAEHIQVFLDSSPLQKSQEKEKIERAFRSYLEKLRRHCNALPLAALGGEDSPDEDITLDKIYIELDTTQTEQRLEEASDQETRLGAAGLIARPENRTPVSVMKAAMKSKRLVLLGNAGAGKSTFVKVLLALQAAVLLGERKEPLPGFGPDLIPVLIVLRDLSPRLAALELEKLSGEEQRRALANAILEKIRVDVRNYGTADFLPVLEESVERGRILLALDGLDEVPQSLRGRVRQAVGALIHSHEIERTMVTSRSRSYTGQAVFPNFQAYTIAPFDEDKIRNFARAWYHERCLKGHIQADQVEIRAKNLADAAIDPDLIEMSSNPMMLTSIALLHQREIGLPRERVRLYKLVVDVLISRWQKYKTGEEEFVPSEALARFLRDDLRLRATLELLAYEAHRLGSKMESKSERSLEADLPRSHALTLLESREFLGDLNLASEFLDYVDQRAGLLVGKGGDLEHPTSYSFPHRTIQEYLAGCYMIGRRRPVREYYRHAAEGDFWSLAAIMGAEELFYNRRNTNDLLDLAYELCPPGEPQGEQDERALLWSGQVAGVAGIDTIRQDTGSPSGGNAYLQRLIPRTVGLLESRLPPRERAEAGDTLARLGDPRFDPERWHLPSEPLAGFVPIPASEFRMGTRESDINMLKEKFGGDEDWYKRETPQHRLHLPDYYIARYPVTAAQFKSFVEDSGYKPRHEGTLRGMSNHPVVYVTWYDALEYCKWLAIMLREMAQTAEAKTDLQSSFWQGIATGKLTVTLPSEAEWEKAARGDTDARMFPWGNEFDQEKVNANMILGNTSAVGCFPGGASPYGIQDMSGNVWEWTHSEYKKYPFDPEAKLEKIKDTNIHRVLRGGAFYFDERSVRCACRDGSILDDWFSDVGFRVVVSPFS